MRSTLIIVSNTQVSLHSPFFLCAAIYTQKWGFLPVCAAPTPVNQSELEALWAEGSSLNLSLCEVPAKRCPQHVPVVRFLLFFQRAS